MWRSSAGTGCIVHTFHLRTATFQSRTFFNSATSPVCIRTRGYHVVNDPVSLALSSLLQAPGDLQQSRRSGTAGSAPLWPPRVRKDVAREGGHRRDGSPPGHRQRPRSVSPSQRSAFGRAADDGNSQMIRALKRHHLKWTIII